ncbi:MAG: response regulator [Raoultibacter sp.]|jgi:DNA-binding NarL/FixJ family response regulator
MNEEILGGESLYDERYRVAQQHLRKKSEEALRQAEQKQEKPKITLLIVDDQELVRSGFRLILSSYDNLTILGEATNGLEATRLARELQPDLVLMDIRMPVMNGIEATEAICSDPECEATRVLVLTTFDLDEYIYDALTAGASGFLLKDSEPNDIVAAIEVIAAGDALIQPSITKRLIEAFVGSRPHLSRKVSSLEQLTERETEILSLVALGLSNQEIADRLVISPATVKTHLARIMSKTDAHDRAQLVVIAYENGLVVPGA